MKIDAILTPGLILPASLIPYTNPLTFLSNIYLALSNFLGFISGTLPVTSILDGEDRWDPVRD